MEKATFHDQLSDLRANFPGATQVTLTQAAKYIGVDPRSLKGAKGFPVKKIGGRYWVNLINLARWLA